MLFLGSFFLIGAGWLCATGLFGVCLDAGGVQVSTGAHWRARHTAIERRRNLSPSCGKGAQNSRR
jgi:hypothetical protein